MSDTQIFKNLNKNEEYLKKTIGSCIDTQYRHISVKALGDCDALLVYIRKMVKEELLERFVVEPLKNVDKLEVNKPVIINKDNMQKLVDYEIVVLNSKEVTDWVSVCDAVISGDSVLFLEKSNTALIVSTKGWDSRAISEPVTEGEVRGPRDGFIEDVNTNISLIRRRIRDYGLRFEYMKIGERTKTDIYLAYIEGIVNETNLQELRQRLKRIKIDAIIGSGYVEEFIEDNSFTIFPLIDHTERPDKACSAILEGRIIVLVDNAPYVMIVPTVFWQYLQAPGDYYERPYVGTFARWIRFLGLFLSMSVSSFYVLLSSYHQEMIPTPLALNIAGGREGVPFPAVVEALSMEILFEVLREAGIRMPRPIGQTVSIVGALVVGQAAVAAGLVGPSLIIVIAISAISSFALPSYSMGNALRILRFPMIILSSVLGLVGYLLGIIVVALHLMSLRSFGVPFLSPLIPFDKSGNQDVLVRLPWWKMLKRPPFSRSKDTYRQKNGLRPGPKKR